jgi:hypothetical protein
MQYFSLLDPNKLGNHRTHYLDLEPGKFGQLLLLLMYEASCSLLPGPP